LSQKSSLYRTVEILKMLNEGKKLCVTTLAYTYAVSDRTIRRDFELIKELFGDFMSKEGDCYLAYKKILLEDVLTATDLMTLANIVNLFNITHKASLISDKTQALINKSMNVYDFKSRPFENLQNTDILKKLEHAIRFNKIVELTYQTEINRSSRIFCPYKILFLKENFYLVGINITHQHQFEFLRISLIQNVADSSKTFHKEQSINTFIDTIQTPWAIISQPNITVKIRVSKKIRRFFILKKYLPSQEVVKTYENGDIAVQYKISSYNEIEELIIKWLPYIKILSPENLIQKIKKQLHFKLKAFDDSFEFVKQK